MTDFRGRLPLVFWLMLLTVATWIVFGHVRLTTELTAFLPRGVDRFEQMLVEEVRDGPAARVILMALEGGSRDTLRDSSLTLTEQLRDSGFFTYVNNGSASAWPTELLFENRYLLSPNDVTAGLTVERLRASLEAGLRAVVLPLGVMEKRLLPRDPTGELRQILQVWGGEQSLSNRKGVWFSDDGTRALLIAETRASAFELDRQTEAMAFIKKAFSSLPDNESLELLISGVPVLAVESRKTIRRELAVLSTLAVGSLVLVLLFVYRSPVLVLFTAIPLVSGILTGAAVIGLIFESIHGITLAFGITIMGVAVDYPIHLFSHTRVGESSTSAATRIWPTLRLGALTTVFGYTAMVFSGFTGLVQLGLFAAVGLSTAVLVTHTVVPRLITREMVVHAPQWAMLSVATTINRLRPLHWLSSVVIIAGGAYIVAHANAVWETDIAELSPISAERRAIDRELRTTMRVPDVRDLLVVTSDSAEHVLHLSERLALALDDLSSRGILTHYDTPSRYLPSQDTQRRRQAALPGEASLRSMLRTAMQGLPFRRGLFEPFVADLVATKSRKPVTLEDFRDTPFELRLSSVLFPQGSDWIAVLPLRGVADRAALSAWVASLKDSTVRYMDLKEAANRLVTRYRTRVLPLLAWGAGAILLALCLGLRSFAAAARVLFPVAAAVVGVVALFVAMGERLSMFHLVALLLVVGVGLDYGLFFNRKAENPAERERTVRALVVCGISTTLVFGILAFSQTPVLATIGATVAVGVALCFVLAAASSRNHVETAPSGASARLGLCK